LELYASSSLLIGNLILAHALGGAGGTGVLLLDEAHHLSDAVLGGLRMLAPLDLKSERLLLQIVLVGQPELEVKLEQPQLRPIHQRIALRCQLKPFPDDEVVHYIHHRLHTVGCERPDLFTPEALHHIAVSSRGLPRLINIICDNALLLAYGKSQPLVSAAIVNEVVANLRITPLANGTIPSEQLHLSLPPSMVAVQHSPSDMAAGTQSLPVVIQPPASPIAPITQAKRRTSLSLATGVVLALILGGVVYTRQATEVRPGVPAAEQGEQPQPQRQSRLARTNRAASGANVAPTIRTRQSPVGQATEAESKSPVPQITQAQPNGQELRVTDGQEVTFMVTVANPHAGLRYTWLLDGNEQSQGQTWPYKAVATDRGQPRIVTVRISDAYRHVVERSWKLHIRNADRPFPPR